MFPEETHSRDVKQNYQFVAMDSQVHELTLNFICY